MPPYLTTKDLDILIPMKALNSENCEKWNETDHFTKQ